MERLAMKHLTCWKESPYRKPLIVKGVRQVGKTWLLKEFGRQFYDNIAYFNFDENPEYREFFATTKDVRRIIPNLAMAGGQDILPGETLLIFDEIQDFPEVATALKFFKENGKYDVICSGSLLGVQYQRIASISVGYKTDYQMYSMDFEEFLWAKGYSEEAISDMLCHMLEGVAFSEAEQVIFSNLFLLDKRKKALLKIVLRLLTK